MRFWSRAEGILCHALRWRILEPIKKLKLAYMLLALGGVILLASADLAEDILYIFSSGEQRKYEY